MNTMARDIRIWVLGIVGILIFGEGAYLYLQSKNAGPTYTIHNPPQAVLVSRNEEYANAVAYKKEGKYDLALQSYEKALLVAQDRFQAAQIKFNIAGMNEKLGNYTTAITGLKEIVADDTNSSIARANAAQEIGLMYSVYALSVEPAVKEEMLSETFKGSPYETFKSGTNLNLAYTRLYEYATSLYPVGASEARVASGYTGELFTTLKGATTTPQGKTYVDRIKQSLKAADADIARMKNIPGEAVLIPSTLVREGAVLGRLATVGAATAAEAEPYFKAGLAYDQMQGNSSGSFNAFNYAAFLVEHYGAQRASDLKSILSVFRVGNEKAIYADIARFLRTARTDASLAKNKAQMVVMAREVPSFKEYLLSLGWTAADFK